jgi:hypothetical protein
MRTEEMETTKDADVPRKALSFVAQFSEFSHLDLAQRRPAAKEDRHALVAALTRRSKLLTVECGQVRGEALDHGGKASQHYDAPPNGTPTGFLPSPNHFRIFALKLRITSIGTSLVPPWRDGRGGQGEEGLVECHCSCTP